MEGERRRKDQPRRIRLFGTFDPPLRPMHEGRRGCRLVHVQNTTVVKRQSDTDNERNRRDRQSSMCRKAVQFEVERMRHGGNERQSVAHGRMGEVRYVAWSASQLDGLSERASQCIGDQRRLCHKPEPGLEFE